MTTMTDLIYRPRMSWRAYEAHLKAHDYNMNTPRLWVSQYGWKEASRVQDEVENLDDYEIDSDPEDRRSQHD
jgi:hypothetical protein